MSRQRSDPAEVRGGSLGPLFDGVRHDYHNTVGLKDDELRERCRRAKSQEDRILWFFKNNSEMLCPPHFFQYSGHDLFDSPVPITSIRRALTNLTTAGLLTKTDVMVRGPYGDPVHCWRLRRDS